MASEALQPSYLSEFSQSFFRALKATAADHSPTRTQLTSSEQRRHSREEPPRPERSSQQEPSGSCDELSISFESSSAPESNGTLSPIAAAEAGQSREADQRGEAGLSCEACAACPPQLWPKFRCGHAVCALCAANSALVACRRGLALASRSDTSALREHPSSEPPTGRPDASPGRRLRQRYSIFFEGEARFERTHSDRTSWRGEALRNLLGRRRADASAGPAESPCPTAVPCPRCGVRTMFDAESMELLSSLLSPDMLDADPTAWLISYPISVENYVDSRRWPESSRRAGPPDFCRRRARPPNFCPSPSRARDGGNYSENCNFFRGADVKFRRPPFGPPTRAVGRTVPDASGHLLRCPASCAICGTSPEALPASAELERCLFFCSVCCAYLCQHCARLRHRGPQNSTLGRASLAQHTIVAVDYPAAIPATPSSRYYRGDTPRYEALLFGNDGTLSAARAAQGTVSGACGAADGATLDEAAPSRRVASFVRTGEHRSSPPRRRVASFARTGTHRSSSPRGCEPRHRGQRMEGKILRMCGLDIGEWGEEFPIEEPTVKAYKCPNHPTEPVHFFCLTCEVPCFCGYCCVEQVHLGHEVVDVDEAWKVVKEHSLEGEILPRLEQLAEDSCRLEPAIHDMRTDILGCINDAKSGVEMTLASIVQAVQASERELGGKLDELRGKLESEVEACLQEVEAELKRLCASAREMHHAAAEFHNYAKYCRFYREQASHPAAPCRRLLAGDVPRRFLHVVPNFRDALYYSVETAYTKLAALDQVGEIVKDLQQQPAVASDQQSVPDWDRLVKRFGW